MGCKSSITLALCYDKRVWWSKFRKFPPARASQVTIISFQIRNLTLQPLVHSFQMNYKWEYFKNLVSHQGVFQRPQFFDASSDVSRGKLFSTSTLISISTFWTDNFSEF